MTIEVLIIDDSAVARQSLMSLFPAPDFDADTAIDALFALQKMERHWPDVVVLDLELPRLDGLGFLKKVMAQRPTPVVVCSGLTERGAQTSIAALSAGAVAVFPKTALRAGSDGGAELVRLVRAAASSHVAKPEAPHAPARAVLSTGPTRSAQLIAIGASTGGPQSLETVLTALGPTCPPIAIVQHMPEKFTRAFAERLDGLCSVQVREAQGGEVLVPGSVVIAPGGRHLAIRKVGLDLVTEVVDAPPVNRHCPSVDVLFRSVVKLAGVKAVGVLMTGMGDDGARGLLELRNAGAPTYAQDEASCIVYGMPKEAARLGAAESVISLHQIAPTLMSYVKS